MATYLTMHKQVIDLLKASKFSEFASEIAYFIKPSIRLSKTLTRSGKKSYFGGTPNRQADFPYPIFDPTECLQSKLRHSHRNRCRGSSYLDREIELLEQKISKACSISLPFLCQICLSEIPNIERFPDIPNSGFLCVFADRENDLIGWENSCDGAWRVIFSDAQNPVLVDPVGANQDDGHDDTLTPYREINFESIWMMGAPEQDMDSINNSALGQLDGSELNRILKDGLNYHEYIAPCCGTDHRLFGYPGYIQNFMQEKCQEKFARKYPGEVNGGMEDWILLLQLDTDNELNWFFGDCGRLFFWIRQQDLKALDFSKVCCLFQSC